MDNKKHVDNNKLVKDIDSAVKILDYVGDTLSVFTRTFDKVDNRNDIFDNITVFEPIGVARDFRDDIDNDVLGDIKAAYDNLSADAAAIRANKYDVIGIGNKVMEKRFVINIDVADENVIWKVINAVEDNQIETIRKIVNKLNDFMSRMKMCDIGSNDDNVKNAVLMNAWCLYNQLDDDKLINLLNAVCETMEKMRGWKH